jgi:hypothetical protein
MVYGTEGWRSFNRDRLGPIEENDPFHNDGFFYLSEGREPQVRKAVRKWMDNLRQHDRLKIKEGSLAGLLNLIETGVLVCDLKQRLKADELTKELEKLKNVASIEADDGLPPIMEVTSHEERSSSPSTPAINLESPHLESGLGSSSALAERRRSTTKELMDKIIRSRNSSPVKQGPASRNMHSSMAVPKPPPQQALGSSSSAHNTYTESSPPKHPYKTPSRSSTITTAGSSGSDFSTTVEPTMTRQVEGDEQGSL